MSNPCWFCVDLHRLRGLVHLCACMWVSFADVSCSRLCFVNRYRWWWIRFLCVVRDTASVKRGGVLFGGVGCQILGAESLNTHEKTKHDLFFWWGGEWCESLSGNSGLIFVNWLVTWGGVGQLGECCSECPGVGSGPDGRHIASTSVLWPSDWSVLASTINSIRNLSWIQFGTESVLLLVFAVKMLV